MLHVTTEIGKSGRQEREKRHFPDEHNKPGVQTYRLTGRRYLPHNHGTSDDWTPHGSYKEVKYSENGPDWKSRLRWLPHPQNPKYPAAELWPIRWHSTRILPWNYKTRTTEWEIHPSQKRTGRKCLFGGIHRATEKSTNEITPFMLYGNGRSVSDIDQRNGMSMASPGDKAYQAVEYSSHFHRLGSTLPIPNFSGGNTRKPDTFIPLQRSSTFNKEPYKVVNRRRLNQEEVEVVRSLEAWKPAPPLMSMLP